MGKPQARGAVVRCQTLPTASPHRMLGPCSPSPARVAASAPKPAGGPGEPGDRLTPRRDSGFAQYCGHQSASSGPFRTKLAAFRDWSMVTTKDGRVLLTELGKTWLARRTRWRTSCFSAVPSTRARSSRVSTTTRPRTSLSSARCSGAERCSASRSRRSRRSGSSRRWSTARPRWGSRPPTPRRRPSPSQGAAGADVRHEPDATPPETGGTQPGTSGGTGTIRGPPTTSNAPVLLRQVWPTATGEIVLAIHSTAPLSASAFGLVGQVVQAAADLADSIGPDAPTADDAA